MATKAINEMTNQPSSAVDELVEIARRSNIGMIPLADAKRIITAQEQRLAELEQTIRLDNVVKERNAELEAQVEQQEQRIGELREALSDLVQRTIDCDNQYNQGVAQDDPVVVAAQAALENSKPAEGTCEWKENSDYGYDTSCGQAFEMINNEPLAANGFKFCYHCGKAIAEV